MIELNKIYNADCLEKMNDIPDGSVDAIITDLPYGTTACKWDSVIPFEPLWEQYRINTDITVKEGESIAEETLIEYVKQKMPSYRKKKYLTIRIA